MPHFSKIIIVIFFSLVVMSSLALITRAQDIMENPSYRLKDSYLEVQKTPYPQNLPLSKKENDKEEITGQFKIVDRYLISDIPENEFLDEYSYLKSGFQDLSISIEVDQPLFNKEDFHHPLSFLEKTELKLKSLLGIETQILPEYRLIKEVDKSKSIQTKLDLSKITLITDYKKTGDGPLQVKQTITLKNNSEQDLNLSLLLKNRIDAEMIHWNEHIYSISENPQKLGDSAEISFYSQNMRYFSFYDFSDIPEEFLPELWVQNRDSQALLVLSLNISLPAHSSKTIDPEYSSLKAKEEIIGKRTRNSKTTWKILPNLEQRYVWDGTIGAIHYKDNPRDEAEQWKEIDNTFESALAPWDWEMLNASYHIRVKEDFTSGQIIEFEKQGETVQLQPMALEWTNDLDQIQQISMPQSVVPIITNPEVDLLPVVGMLGHHGTIRWNNAYGAGLDFEWKCTSSKLAKILEIENFSKLSVPEQYIFDGGNPVLRLNLIFAPSSDMDIYVDGELWDKKVKKQTFDVIEFRKVGEVLWGFMPLRYWGSGEGENNIGQSVATIEKRGNKLYISIRVPYEWLQSAVYPVFIDAVVDEQVGASSDDAHRILSTDFWSLADTIMAVGAYNSTNYQKGAGMRFTTVAVEGTINVAYLTVVASSLDTSSLVKSRISAEDVDDALTFADDATAFDTRWASRTTARVDWDDIASWTGDVAYNSPSIITVIQEIVDRVGWVSDNDIVIFWDDFEDRTEHLNIRRRADSWDHPTSDAPKLHIEYTVAPTNATPTVGTVTLNSGNNITLTENTTTTVSATATITDTDGISDISTTTGKLYRSGVGSGCSADDNNCYIDSTCATTTPCAATSCTAVCNYDVWFHADPTDAGDYSAQHWEAWIKVIDTENASSSATSTGVEMNTLRALDLSTTTIDYGTLDSGDDTGTLNQTTTITDTGNEAIDIYLYGTDLTGSAGADDWLGISSTNLNSHCGDSHPIYTLAEALDGVDYWIHGVNEIHWFVIDLGQTNTIKKVRGRSNYLDDPIDVNIYIDDNNPPTTLCEEGITTWQDTDEWVEITLTTEGTGRYIKVEIEDTEDSSRYILFGKYPTPFTIFDAYGALIPSIPVGYQEWSTSTGVSYGSGTNATSSTSTVVELDLSKPTAHSPNTSTDDIYWGLGVPADTKKGTYNATATVEAKSD